MFLLDQSNSALSKINQKTFGELGFKERDHLQEWIADNPDVFDEELLIIQKEFSGFADTNERLDLLALDKQGNLVIIENKLDDSGKDVAWQALKYTSYCSSLTKDNIKSIYGEYLAKNSPNENAEENLKEFFDNRELDELDLNIGNKQRIILVAANFRKEVTSTVLWLLSYNIRVQCFRVSLYEINDRLCLNFEQIIPMQDSEEYLIGMAEKNQADVINLEGSKIRNQIKMKFWEQLLDACNRKFDKFQNISPSKDTWMGAGTGISFVAYNFTVSKTYVRVEIYMSRSVKEENKLIFDELYKRKKEIEHAFGKPLVWERLDKRKASRIKFQFDDVNIYQETNWPDITERLSDAMVHLYNSFNTPIQETRDILLKYLKK